MRKIKEKVRQGAVSLLDIAALNNVLGEVLAYAHRRANLETTINNLDKGIVFFYESAGFTIEIGEALNIRAYKK